MRCKEGNPKPCCTGHFKTVPPAQKKPPSLPASLQWKQGAAVWAGNTDCTFLLHYVQHWTNSCGSHITFFYSLTVISKQKKLRNPYHKHTSYCLSPVTSIKDAADIVQKLKGYSWSFTVSATDLITVWDRKFPGKFCLSDCFLDLNHWNCAMWWWREEKHY